MITEKQALKLLKHYLQDKNRINHSVGVSKIAFDIAKQIKKKHPSLNINPEKLKIAGLLHDIGRSEKGYHEINSREILKAEGLTEIADIIIHGFVFEQKFIETGKYDKNLLPINLENKILTLADMYYDQNQQKVSLKKRFDDIRDRYENDENFLKAVNLAWERFKHLEKEIKILL